MPKSIKLDFFASSAYLDTQFPTEKTSELVEKEIPAEYLKSSKLLEELKPKEKIQRLLLQAKEELFLEPDFFSSVLEQMAHFDFFSINNLLLIAFQNPKATRLCTQQSFEGLGIKVKDEELSNPIWLNSLDIINGRKIFKPERYYDVSQVDNPELIFSAKEIIYDIQKLAVLATHQMDELGLEYRDNVEGVSYQPEKNNFLSTTGTIPGYTALFFEAIKALAQRDMVLNFDMDLSDNTAYIAESVAYVIAVKYHMLKPRMSVKMPQKIGSEQVDTVLGHLEKIRRISQYQVDKLKQLTKRKTRGGAVK